MPLRENTLIAQASNCARRSSVASFAARRRGRRSESNIAIFSKACGYIDNFIRRVSAWPDRGRTGLANRALPSGFESLEPFVADWVLPDAVARMSKRQASTMDEIRRFYDAIIPIGDKALDYL